MVRGSSILVIFALGAPQLAMAQTTNFADGAAILGKSCAPDIDANCRGVNFDATRLKDCLYRNQDTMSAQCKADYSRGFDAIQKRIAARANVARQCEYEIVKKCRGKAKEASKSLDCLLSTSPVSAKCSQAIGDVGYKTTSDVATRLGGLETPPELDLVALRQQVAERSKSRGKNEPPPQKRPPIAPELSKLPAYNVDIQFDADTPIVRPESYQALGQIADTLVNSALLNYEFLVVGHTEFDGQARKQRAEQPAKGRRGPRHPDQHLQDIVKAASVDRIGRGATARPGPSQCAREQPDADHNVRESA